MSSLNCIMDVAAGSCCCCCCCRISAVELEGDDIGGRAIHRARFALDAAEHRTAAAAAVVVVGLDSR